MQEFSRFLPLPSLLSPCIDERVGVGTVEINWSARVMIRDVKREVLRIIRKEIPN